MISARSKSTLASCACGWRASGAPTGPAVVAAAPARAAAPAEEVTAAPFEPGAVEIAGAVKSPMVGTAYLRPTPNQSRSSKWDRW